MKIKKNVMTVVFAALVANGLQAESGVWTNVGNATSAFAPMSWNSPDNWRDGKIPNGGSDVADFKSVAAPAGTTRWISVPDGTVFKDLLFDSGAGQLIFIGDGSVGMTGSVQSGLDSAAPNLFLYANLNLNGWVMNVEKIDVCGDIVGEGRQLNCAYGYLRLRPDLYANSSDPVRRNSNLSSYLSVIYGHVGLVGPRGAPEISAKWRLHKGSGLAVRGAGQQEHALAVGTVVVCDRAGVLAEGTFLKRVFPDGTIELSNPANLENESEELTLTFAAFAPHFYQRVENLWDQNIDARLEMRFSKYAEQDDVVIDFYHLARNPVPTPEAAEVHRTIFGCEDGMRPAKVILRDVPMTCHFVFEDSDIQFEPLPSGSTCSLPGLERTFAARMAGPDYSARFTVTNGLAVINQFTNLVGTVTKSGAGTLEIGLMASYRADGTLANTGTLVVDGGTLAVKANDDGSLPAVADLRIASAGTLSIPKTGLHADSLSFGDGGTLSGGTLYVDNRCDLSGLNLIDGAAVVFEIKGDASGRRVINALSADGTFDTAKPAFWVDASRRDTFVFDSEPDGTVKRWNDCRGTGPEYMFATNAGTACPVLKTVKRNPNSDRTLSFLQIDNVASKVPADWKALVWDRPLANIRAVFKVLDPGVGRGCSMIGGSPRVGSAHYDDFRICNAPSMSSMLFQFASAHVLNGKIYMNGERTTADSLFPCGMYSSSGFVWYRPVVEEVHTTGNTSADVFGYMYNTDYGSFNGYDTVCECLVYTNELSYAERAEVCQYLMKKWCGSEADFDRYGDGPLRLEMIDVGVTNNVGIRAGEIVSVDTLRGAGTLTKGGKGELYLDDAADASTSLRVLDGTVTVRAVDPVRENLPEGVYLHVDASDSASVVTDDSGNVTQWRDCRGEGYLTAKCHENTTNWPHRVQTVIGGESRSVIDFGPRMSATDDTLTGKRMATALIFDYVDEIRTAVMVVGSRQGGGELIGSTKSEIEGGLARGNDGSSWADALHQHPPSYVPRFDVNCSCDPHYAGGTRARVNRGALCKVSETGLSGGFDLVSLALCDAVGMNALGGAFGWCFRCGGQELAEALYYEEKLSDESVARIEAYLNEKWFGVEKPRAYRGAAFDTVEVADGAVVRVEGDSPVVVKTLKGAGTIDGAVRLAPGAALEVEVNGDSVPVLSFDPDLGAPVVVKVTGSLKGLAVGNAYPIVISDSIRAGDAVAWTLEVSGSAGGKTLTIEPQDGQLVLKVSKQGLTMTLR